MTLEFYLYGTLFYISFSLVLSYAISVYSEYKDLQKLETKQLLPKPSKQTKQAKVVKIIPDGKVGVCSCCDTYLVDDSYYYSHVDGKKHKQNVIGVQTWLRFITPEEYNNNKIVQKVQKAKAQVKSEDYDEGFVL
jgi:hypothetical protein